MVEVMRISKKIAIVFPSALVAVASTVSVAWAGSAEITGVESGVVQPQAIGECRNDGGACDVAAGKTIASEVNTSVGMDVKVFNATFGTSYSESFTVETGCHEDKMSPGEVLIAFPRGDFVTFRVDGKPSTAFFPNGIQCEKRSDW